MPLPIIAEGLTKGISSIPYAVPILKNLPWVILLYLLKTYFGGAVNRSERFLHSKIIMITVCSPLIPLLPHLLLPAKNHQQAEMAPS